MGELNEEMHINNLYLAQDLGCCQSSILSAIIIIVVVVVDEGPPSLTRRSEPVSSLSLQRGWQTAASLPSGQQPQRDSNIAIKSSFLSGGQPPLDS